MKKLLLVFFWFISVGAIAQEADEPYSYPIIPGSEQWAKLTTSKQMDEVCVVPDDVLKSLSTKALLITCLDYPRLPDVFCANDMQSGFEFCSNHFNGLMELLNRPDLNKILLDYAQEIDVDMNSMTLDPGKQSFFKTAFFELMISQDQILSGYNEAAKKELLNLAIQNLERRKRNGESIGRQVSTALLISRILYKEDSSFRKSSDNNEVLDIFRLKGFVLDLSVIDQVYLAAIKSNIKKS